ncbi:MAG TPA: GyrI-like domain-containing protein [Anaerolineales bacterium]|nr:GyrI-like domain-containing protein [Anaerolineales bacterium]
MITEPHLERRKRQHYVAIRMAVPIPFGKYLQPAWDEVYDWLQCKDIKPSGPALIRYLTTDMSKELDIDVGFTVDKAVKGDDRIAAAFLPAGRYATLLYTGPYRGKGIFKATVALLTWAKENKVKWNVTKKKGVEWWNGRTEFYFSDPAVDKDPSRFKTELAFLLADKQTK